MTLSFTIPGAPVPKARPRLGKFGNAFTPFATRAYEKHVRACAELAMRIHGRTVLEGAVVLTLTLYLPDNRRRDLDNLAKSILDGGNGVLYRDDAQVSELHVYRRKDADNPRAEVEVSSG